MNHTVVLVPGPDYMNTALRGGLYQGKTRGRVGETAGRRNKFYDSAHGTLILF